MRRGLPGLSHPRRPPKQIGRKGDYEWLRIRVSSNAEEENDGG